jgi:hypothetical protein
MQHAPSALQIARLGGIDEAICKLLEAAAAGNAMSVDSHVDSGGDSEAAAAGATPAAVVGEAKEDEQEKKQEAVAALEIDSTAAAETAGGDNGETEVAASAMLPEADATSAGPASEYVR